MKKVSLEKYREISNTNYIKYNRLVNKLANARLVTFILMIIMFIVAYYSSSIFNYVGFILLFVFVVMVIIHSKYYKLESYYANYLRIVDEYFARFTDDWHSFRDGGADFFNDSNIYLQDLDVIGKNSLFQYLSVAKTLGGRRELYKRFITFNKDTSSVLELSENLDFCIDYQIALLKFEGKNIDLEDIYQEIDRNIGKRKVDLIIGFVFSGITICLLLLSLFNFVNIKYFYGMFIVNFLASYLYQIIYSDDFKSLTRCIESFSKLKEIYDCIVRYEFKSKVLNSMQDEVRISMDAVEDLNKLEVLSNLKDNVIASFIFNGLFSVNILTMYLYSKIKLNADLKLGIKVVEKLEAMVSLAGVGVVKENKCVPNVNDSVKISFNELYHPLMKESKCVPNSFSSTAGVNIITGSNMGGKSTFLRTIGINLVLALAGGLVNAKRFEYTNFKIFTSMRVPDDALRGISTFYGELLRVKEAIDYSNASKPMVVFIDEIFKGTNYNDRIYGALEVIRKLDRRNVILCITTHDFELCDVSNVWNYYFKEYYEGDRIKFDYRLRNGKCESTNARYLMAKLGIIKSDK